MNRLFKLLSIATAAVTTAAPAFAQSFDMSGFTSGPQGVGSDGMSMSSGAAGAASVMTSGSPGQQGASWDNGHTVKGYNDMNTPAMAYTSNQRQSVGGMGSIQNLNVMPGPHGLARVFGYGGGGGGIPSLGGWVPSNPLAAGLGAIKPPENFGYGNFGGVGTGASNNSGGGGVAIGPNTGGPLQTQGGSQGDVNFPGF
ncbi:MAG TPA: hypothetical protein V6C72_07410 [Chroococcales cyanobacterium]